MCARSLKRAAAMCLTLVGLLLAAVMTVTMAACGQLPEVDEAEDSLKSNEAAEMSKTIDTATAVSFTRVETIAITEAVLAGDEGILSAFDESEMEAFLNALQKYRIYPNIADPEDTKLSNLSAICSGYWGYYAYAETIEQRNSTSGMLYEVSSNCAMWAPDSDGNGESDCGGAPDDYMLSFYFGWHDQNASTLKSMLKWTSTNWWVRSLLGNLSGRLYEQTSGGGADNYNVYACVDDYFEPYFSTFRMRKY